MNINDLPIELIDNMFRSDDATVFSRHGTIIDADDVLSSIGKTNVPGLFDADEATLPSDVDEFGPYLCDFEGDNLRDHINKNNRASRVWDDSWLRAESVRITEVRRAHDDSDGDSHTTISMEEDDRSVALQRLNPADVAGRAFAIFGTTGLHVFFFPIPTVVSNFTQTTTLVFALIVSIQ